MVANKPRWQRPADALASSRRALRLVKAQTPAEPIPRADGDSDGASSHIETPAPTARTPGVGQPINSADDPRWVLAVRAAEQLEGSMLQPDRRQRLLRLGKLLGLSPFDCNLVIAIIQDQARRGFAPEYCPTAGEPQLRMVPLPTGPESATRLRRCLIITALVAAIVALEIMIVKAMF